MLAEILDSVVSPHIVVLILGTRRVYVNTFRKFGDTLRMSFLYRLAAAGLTLEDPPRKPLDYRHKSNAGTDDEFAFGRHPRIGFRVAAGPFPAA